MRVLRRTVPVQGVVNALTGGIKMVAFPLLVREMVWPRVGRPGWAMILTALGGAGYLLLGTVSDLHRAYLMVLAIGLAFGPTGAVLTGLTRTRAHGLQMPGAVVAVQSFAVVGFEPLGYVAVGMLAAWTSAGQAITLVGACLLALGLWGASARQIWAVRNG